MSPRPYRLGRREEAAAQTRARILDAARRLLGEEALPGSLSVDAVAREADVARMTVYHQFGSRVGLLDALFDDLAQRGGLQRLPTVFAGPDPRAAVGELVAVLCGFWRSDRTVMRRLRAAAILDPELEAALRARDERRRQGVAVLLGRIRGGDADADIVDLVTALTAFETYDALAATRTPEEAAALVERGVRAILDHNS